VSCGYELRWYEVIQMTLYSNHTRLNCEELESRINPSNVSVIYVGGILTIAGDNNS
jgi:hypothetical protein